ncbi:MAG: PAS domain S-box protein [Terriglobales bacterium]
MGQPAEGDLDSIREQAELLDLASDAIFVRDLTGAVRYWNRGAERLYGWPKAEALGSTARQLLSATYPRPLAEIEAEVLAKGSWEGELEHVRRDGSRLIVSSRWALRRGAAGHPAGILEFNTDITSRRRSEQALRESEARFRALLESAPDALVLVDEYGKIILVNQRVEEVLGYRRAELVGREVEILMPERFRQAHQAHRAAYAAAASPRVACAGLELLALHKDGRDLPVEIRLSPMRIGRRLWVMAAIRDVSDRVRANAELQRLNALELAQTEHLATLGEIAAGLAHEIKNPLAGLAAALEVLAGELGGDPEVMGEVRGQVERIRAIVDDLLHYARPRPLRIENADLNITVARAVHFAGHAAAGRRIRISFAPGALPPVPHDPEHIERMVANLVFNALDAVSAAGRVEVQTEWSAGPPAAALIRVRDNGSGIAPAEMERIFRPFYTTKGSRGNGLGLPLVRRIAELHGGTVAVQSDTGAGSTFTVALPVTARGQAAEARP